MRTMTRTTYYVLKMNTTNYGSAFIGIMSRHFGHTVTAARLQKNGQRKEKRKERDRTEDRGHHGSEMCLVMGMGRGESSREADVYDEE